jgi:hypothetical protein
MVKNKQTTPDSSGSEISVESVEHEESKITSALSSNLTSTLCKNRKHWRTINLEMFNEDNTWEQVLLENQKTEQLLRWFNSHEISVVQFCLMNIDSVKIIFEKDINNTFLLFIHKTLSLYYLQYFIALCDELSCLKLKHSQENEQQVKARKLQTRTDDCHLQFNCFSNIDRNFNKWLKPLKPLKTRKSLNL